MPFIFATHGYKPLRFGYSNKIYLKKKCHYQIKVRGHDKGHLRPKSQIAIGSWIFSDFDYRHIVELKSKFWCTIGHHLVLFQFWPNLLS